MSRYQVKVGSFEQYIYDSLENKPVPIADVVALLNADDSEHVRDLTKEIKEVHAEGQRALKDRDLMTAERDALAADLQAERDGHKALLAGRFGIRDDETMFQFVERLATECRPHNFDFGGKCTRCGVPDTVGAERDEDRVREQCRYDLAIGALKTAGIESRGVAMGIDELAEERDAAQLVSNQDGGHLQAVYNALNNAGQVGNDSAAERVTALAAERDRYRTAEKTVVNVIGGRVEGQPTQVINYLQRLRALLNAESERDVLLRHEAVIEEDLMTARRVLTEAGVGSESSDTGPRLTTAQRIAILARRSAPHESPGRTAHVAALESAAVRVLNAWLPDTACGTPYTNILSAMDALRQAVKGVDPRGYYTVDPATAETECANMLKEVDDLLEDRGEWCGGRLDSIEALMAARDSAGARRPGEKCDDWVARTDAEREARAFVDVHAHRTVTLGTAADIIGRLLAASKDGNMYRNALQQINEVVESVRRHEKHILEGS